MLERLDRKLQVRPGLTLLVMNAPDGYFEKFEASLPKVTCVQESNGPVDAVFLFARHGQDLRMMGETAVASVKPKGVFWAAYPKRSSGMLTDLTRDKGWYVFYNMDWQAVRQVSIDDIWSALQFRPRPTDDELLDAQYTGKKAHLRPIYDRLIELLPTIDPTIRVGVRVKYVVLRQNQTFAHIQASTKNRLDLGLRLRGKPFTPRLIDSVNLGADQITHKVGMTKVEDVDDEVMAWLKEAYEADKDKPRKMKW